MLFRIAQLRGIAAGEIDLQFRRWDRPRARAGSTQVTSVGVIRIDDVRRVKRITRAEAKRAGFGTPEDAVRALRPDGDLYRIELHLEGPDPRVALRETIPEDFAELRAKVERLPWGFEYLRAIASTRRSAPRSWPPRSGSRSASSSRACGASRSSASPSP